MWDTLSKQSISIQEENKETGKQENERKETIEKVKMAIVIKPRYKKENEKIADFIGCFERLVISNEWSDETAGKMFPTLLESDSSYLEKIDDLAGKRKFTAILSEQEPYRGANVQKLLNLKFAGDSIEEHRKEVVRLVETVYTKFAKANKEILAKDFFINSLPNDLKYHVLKMAEKTAKLEDVVNMTILAKNA